MYTLAATVILGAVTFFSKISADVYESYYTLNINNKEINLITVRNSESRERGLSNTKSLPDNTAMLFVFDEPDKYGIWMKDMKFPIDIMWMDDSHRIVYQKENVSPNTFPEIFSPNEKILYILEANAGFMKRNNLSVGNYLNLIQK